LAAFLIGPLLTLGFAMGFEALSPLLIQLPSPLPIPVLLLAVVYAAFRGGLFSGLVSAGVMAIYTLYFFSAPGQFLRFNMESALQGGVLCVTALALAVMVGILQHVHEQTARLQGALLAARTMEHYLNNQLTATVGYCEMLAHNDGLPAAARQQAQLALQGAENATDTLARLVRVTRLEEDAGLTGPSVLDLQRSANSTHPAEV
jgi:hypothetical protein